MANKESKTQEAREKIAKGTLILGQLAKDPRQAITIAAQAAAGLIRGDGAATFAKVFDSLAKKGELDPKFPDSSKGRYFIQEIDDALNIDIKDEEMLLTKIRLFIAIASNTYKDSSQDEAKEVWEIIKRLDTKDIKVLATVYNLWRKDGNQQTTRFTSIEEWTKHIALKSELKFNEFVDESSSSLKAQRLLSGDFNTNYMMSELGICVAGYLVEGERLFNLALAE